MSKQNDIISLANPHTIKKFELIEKYVKAWAQKLLFNDKCKNLVFIDCMSNCGEYVDDFSNHVFGTPVRVATYLKDISKKYPTKEINLFFNDFSEQKTKHLKTLMPEEGDNFHYHITTGDGNALAKKLGEKREQNKHSLLIYDPYEAAIDWYAISPFINNWNEVIINHMVSDSIRAVKMVKSDEARDKYEHTYLADLEDLILYGNSRKAFEDRIETIIRKLRHNQKKPYYLAAFPFFNERNAVVYHLIHCTSNIEGFKLFKKCAWQTFGGKSSTKNTHGAEKQLMLDFDGSGINKTQSDESCYYVKDIAEYLQNEFKGKQNVLFSEIWAALDRHPIFPSDGFRNEIKDNLKRHYSAVIERQTISFSNKG